MVNLKRQKVLFRCFAAFMALYLFNISVDPQDARPVYQRENLGINEQESLIELVVEKLMGYDDAITEYDDNDSEDGFSLKKTLSVDFFILPSQKTPEKPAISNTEKTLFSAMPVDITGRASEIHSPPPEV